MTRRPAGSGCWRGWWRRCGAAWSPAQPTSVAAPTLLAHSADVAALLKLRPQVEIAIGANGVGVPDPTRDLLHLRPVPWAAVAE